MFMEEFNDFFDNEYIIKDNIYILDNDDEYAENFGKQWKKYRDIQIDSKNNFNISKDFLEDILFNQLNVLNNKNVLEIGCGAGRFTEHIVKYAKKCVSVDLSTAIFYNISKEKENLILVKADLHKLNIKNKFDIVICRGVIQHTPNPYKTIKKLASFINKDGCLYFDVYPKPKINILHPKYSIWRPIIQKMIKYETMDNFLCKNIKILLKIKRFVKLIFLNNDFLADSIMPIWDYKNKLKLNDQQLEKWAILDTLDGLYAKYDNPLSHLEISNFLIKNNLEIIENRKDINCFKVQIKNR